MLSNEELAKRLRVWGIVIASAGLLVTVFGVDALIQLGAANQTALTVLSLAGRVVASFGMPLAAIFMGISIILPRISGISRASDRPEEVSD